MTAKLDNAIGLYMEGIRDGDPYKAMATYTGDRYRQHSTGVPDGKDGFITFFHEFTKRNPVREIDVIRTIEDGRYVFLQVHQRLNNDDVQWVTNDIFDTDDNDKLIEHWDIIEAYTESNPSGRSSIDGPTEVADLDKTGQNKAMVREMIEQVLMRDGDPERIGDFIAEDYMEHNAEVPDGLDTLKALATAPDRTLWYDEIFLLLGQGNFVATLCKVTNDGEPWAHCDIFRVDDGKIVEHWGSAEPVGPKEGWANSGKF